MAHFIEDRPGHVEHNFLGFTAFGYHKDTICECGFNYSGIHKYTRGLYHEFGFNQSGFTKSWRNFFTGTDLDQFIYDVNGKSQFYGNDCLK